MQIDTNYYIDNNETRIWIDSNNNYHRIDGPAVERANGTKHWYIYGQLHRTDGPAVEWADGTKEWWFKGKQISKEEYYSNEFQVKIVMEG